jgi:hypothetical protein
MIEKVCSSIGSMIWTCIIECSPSSLSELAIARCVLDTLTVDDIRCLVKLHVALGKCLATTYNVAGSVESYQAALMVRIFWYWICQFDAHLWSLTQCSPTCE